MQTGSPVRHHSLLASSAVTSWLECPHDKSLSCLKLSITQECLRLTLLVLGALTPSVTTISSPGQPRSGSSEASSSAVRGNSGVREIGGKESGVWDVKCHKRQVRSRLGAPEGLGSSRSSGWNIREGARAAPGGPASPQCGETHLHSDLPEAQ